MHLGLLVNILAFALGFIGLQTAFYKIVTKQSLLSRIVFERSALLLDLNNRLLDLFSSYAEYRNIGYSRSETYPQTPLSIMDLETAENYIKDGLAK